MSVGCVRFVGRATDLKEWTGKHERNSHGDVARSRSPTRGTRARKEALANGGGGGSSLRECRYRTWTRLRA